MTPTKKSGVAIYRRYTSDKFSDAFQEFLDARPTRDHADGCATARTAIDGAFGGRAATRSALASVLDVASRNPWIIVIENSDRFRRDRIERAHAFNRPLNDRRMSPAKLKTK